LIVTSEILKIEPLGCMIEVEIYDDAASYARSIFMVSLSENTDMENEGDENSKCPCLQKNK
ncbi:MAG TPA: hypothetical protein DD735_09870, partial [Clostridiales bacterium]|nr:hypothetical protein [Clostridiales bacterium]